MKKLILIITVIVFFSCTNKSLNSNKLVNSYLKEQQESVLKKDTIDFNLNTFTTIPNEIDGCGCYFYLSKEDEKNGNYLFVNDFANIAFVSINSKLEKFELKEHKEASSVYIYSNGNYDLKVEITKKENEGNESSIIIGLIILSKGKSLIEKEFIGSCGC